MSKPARATISDVAKAAKTGKTSISRYLNGEKHLLSDALLAKAKLKESEAEDADEVKEPEPTAEQQTIALLTEIRDQLAKA